MCMKSVKIVAALVVGSILLASECQCDTTDEPADPVEEKVRTSGVESNRY